MKKKVKKRYFHSLETEFDIRETGDGYTCFEIADMCGVLNKTNDNPNKMLVKKIAEEFGLKPSGYIYTDIYNKSNGSQYGYHPKEKPLFDGEELEFIRNFIKACDVSDSKGYYHFMDVAFRKDSNIRIFAKGL